MNALKSHISCAEQEMKLTQCIGWILIINVRKAVLFYGFKEMLQVLLSLKTSLV